MRAHVLAACLAIAALPAVFACGLFFPTVESEAPGSAGDSGGEATMGGGGDGGDAGAADCGFTLTAAPTNVPLTAGQAATVTLQRAGGFTGPISVTLSPPLYVNVQPTDVTIAAGSATSPPFTLTADPASQLQCNLGDFHLTASGSTPDDSCSQTLLLPVHLHGICQAFGTAGTGSVLVPGVDSLQVKAWGGGGGGGGVSGGAGGGGGFVLANIAVTPGETLGVRVGAGGATTGGGDWSGVLRGTAVLVIAGGGGGGGSGADSSGGQCGGGSPGGGGGGPLGATGGQCNLDGGNGATQTADGPTCSAGCVSQGAGGGRGLHSGGGGFCESLTCNTGAGTIGGGLFGGGGGGSGGTEALDAGVTLVTSSTAPYGGAPAGTGDGDYLAGSGVGAAAGSGSPGRVLVIVP